MPLNNENLNGKKLEIKYIVML